MMKLIKNNMMITGSDILIRHSFVSRSHLPIDMNGTSINDDKTPKMKPPMLAKLSMYGNNPRATGRYVQCYLVTHIT